MKNYKLYDMSLQLHVWIKWSMPYEMTIWKSSALTRFPRHCRDNKYSRKRSNRSLRRNRTSDKKNTQEGEEGRPESITIMDEGTSNYCQ